MKKSYNQVNLVVRLMKNDAAHVLLDQGLYGEYEQAEGKDPTITCITDPAILAHEMAHFMESLFGLPASLELPEKMEDCVRGVWRAHCKSEAGHNG